MSSLSFTRKFPFSFKSGRGLLRATLLSGEDDILSCFNNQGAERGSFVNHGAEQTIIKQQPGETAFETPATVITPNSGFLSGVDEFDLDHAVEGFSSIPEAIEDIRQGKVCFLLRCGLPLLCTFSIQVETCTFVSFSNLEKDLQMVIVVDDEDRENEGDLIMAAQLVTPEAMAFIVKHGTGIVCVSMKGEDLDRLQLPLMVPPKENEEKLSTAFTVSVVCPLLFLYTPRLCLLNSSET